MDYVRRYIVEINTNGKPNRVEVWAKGESDAIYYIAIRHDIPKTSIKVLGLAFPPQDMPLPHY